MTTETTREKNNSGAWWRNPQGLVATATIIAMVLGFFYVREKQMWEQSSRIANLEAWRALPNPRIEALETRGAAAIATFNARFDKMDARFERIEQTVGELRDQVNFLERKIDQAEQKLKEMDERGRYKPQ